MFRLFLAELFKLRRSKLWLTSLAVPVFLFSIFLIGLGNVDERPAWTMLETGASYAWAYFLLPMTATVITAMMGQIEYRPNTWSYMLTLPQRKWQVFLVKAIVALVVMALISALVVGASIGAGKVHGLLRPDYAFFGMVPWKHMGKEMFEIWLASFLLIAIQFGVAMRFGGLILPLLTGIGGVFLAILVGTLNQLKFLGIATENYNFMPWLLPANMLSSEAGLGTQTLLIGGLGGGALFIVIAVWLSRKDWN
ncbi:ABC transporter permease [Parvularcula marina]|uniref:ABC transporter permease n=1 Tax=Parvularcula marina TaxID=2292771 RepID=UPI003517605D